MFGFFLMASLIMLSVSAALIGNMNLFSDAMASGKHSDKNYKYQEDEKNYYSDEGDNEYSPEYNYYQHYQPMQQQDEQSGNNNNNYGYDNNDYKDKTISYNTSYEDSKKYSTYPTKDKKYVCQTGQFQGFYVESVEFCKLKIAQGPPGPGGPQGIQGPRGFNGTNGVNGTSGITKLNDTDTYLVTVSVVNVGLTNTIGQANCSSGDFVINGGFAIESVAGGTQNPIELLNRPILSPLGNGWEVLIIPDTPSGLVKYSVHAICFDNSPAHIP
jgi:hypothetical protein